MFAGHELPVEVPLECSHLLKPVEVAAEMKQIVAEHAFQRAS